MPCLARFTAIAALVISAAGLSPHALAQAADKVLIVVSSEGRDQGKTRPGFEMDEFSQTWLLLRANGLEVDVASPAGGPVEADRFDPRNEYNSRVLADPLAQAKLAQTLPTATLQAGDYQAVLVMGGKGAMFDLPKDPALQAFLAAIDTQGGVIAAVCHGPAALVGVQRSDGSALVAGRRLTGMSNEEELIFGKTWMAQFPWLLEDKLKTQGAHWEEASLMMPKVVVDGRLITGQNPFSTVAMTEAVLRALGREPQPRQPFRVEAAMTLAERWLNGERAPVEALLAQDAKAYAVEVIGMLGLYQYQHAGDDANRRQGLALMRLAEPHFKHPRISAAITEARTALGAAPN